MNDEIPMLRTYAYTETVTIRLGSESKKIRNALRNQGINIAEIERRTLEKVYSEINLKLQKA